VRIRFRKDGALRLLSHHDLLRTFERALRRADLPFHRTQGFNPQPRLVFALSLPLGVIGRDEVLELELAEELPAEEVHDRLARQLPAGLALLRVEPIGLKDKARVRGLCYALPVPPERVSGLRARIQEVLAGGECWVERTRPERRRVNLRPVLRDVRVRGPEGSPFLEIDLALKDSGTARPDEVLGLLGLRDLLEAGAVLERTHLELEEERTGVRGQGSENTEEDGARSCPSSLTPGP
jgi:radical SAM-linked protein